MTCEWRHAAKLEESGLPLVRLGVWVKPNGAPQFTGDRPGTGWEAVAILHRPGKKHWNGGGHHAVWMVPKIEGEHPTQKPQKLINEWVRLFSDAGETIFDPYMGSGTTGVACLKLDRKFVGCEVRPDYFEIACRRIEQAYQQGDLFMPKAALPKFEQAALFT
jgi:site-specific DNA-methyltransferase (adenine-specific)